jgi:hypothetical protein
MIRFALEQMEERVATSAESVGPAPAPETVEPFVANYQNPALGDASLTLDGDRLIFDAGEFRGEVRTTGGEMARVAGYVVIEGPLLGLPLNLRDEGGQPELVVLDPTTTEEYVFSVVEAPATPLASPVP